MATPEFDENTRLWAESYFVCNHRAYSPELFDTYCRLANDLCESVIEQHMLAILSCALSSALGDTEMCRRDEFIGVVAGGRFAIVPQMPVKNFRADFLIVMPDSGGSVAIECDGADFHSSPAQAARDNERNKAFAAAGVTVMRFWGKQIMREPREVGGAVSLFVRRQMLARRSNVA